MNHWKRTWPQTAFVLLLILMPLPRHWVLAKHTYAGIYYESTSLSFYVADAGVLLFLLLAILSRQSSVVSHQSAVGNSQSAIRNPQSALHTPHPLTRPLVLLALLAAVSAVWTWDLVLTAQLVLRLALALALYLAIVHVRPEERWVQVGVAAVIVTQAAAALLQFYRQDDLGLRWLGELDLVPQPGGTSILTVGDQFWLRGYGLTPHPNILGGLLATFLLILTAAYLEARPRFRLLWLSVYLAGLAGLFFTFSRSAWLAAVAGGGLLGAGLLWQQLWRHHYGRALAGLALAGGLLLGGLGWRYQHLIVARASPGGSYTEGRSINERRALNEAGLILVQLAPLTGVGAGNSAAAIVPFAKDQPGVASQPIHNVPLLLTAELGLAGGALWLWLTIVPLAVALYRLYQGQLSLWALALTAALVALAVVDLFDYYTWGWMQGRLLRWVCWGLWAGAIIPQAVTTRSLRDNQEYGDPL